MCVCGLYCGCDEMGVGENVVVYRVFMVVIGCFGGDLV